MGKTGGPNKGKNEMEVGRLCLMTAEEGSQFLVRVLVTPPPPTDETPDPLVSVEEVTAHEQINVLKSRLRPIGAPD